MISYPFRGAIEACTLTPFSNALSFPEVRQVLVVPNQLKTDLHSTIIVTYEVSSIISSVASTQQKADTCSTIIIILILSYTNLILDEKNKDIAKRH